MPYKFTFDLTTIPKSFFKEIARIAHKKKLYTRLSDNLKTLAEKFRIEELTGLRVTEVIAILEDLVDIYSRNLLEKEKFEASRKRVLLLPHCARKYMDNRCQAEFKPAIPSYFCRQCSKDCLIHQATIIGKRKGYDVYVLPGGSCVSRILKDNSYDGVVGVACGEELKIAGDYLKEAGTSGQAIPLLKNGCANTYFNIEILEKML
jgi:hypothetical protein